MRESGGNDRGERITHKKRGNKKYTPTATRRPSLGWSFCKTRFGETPKLKFNQACDV